MAVPWSSDGADCTDGGADWTGGVMKKGNSCSGVAAAEPENAMVPIASAPKAGAAQRQFSLNASRLSMIDPCLSARAPISARCWQDHYRTRVSGCLRQRRKMTSSGKELFRRGVAKKEILNRRRCYFPLFHKGRGNSLWGFS